MSPFLKSYGFWGPFPHLYKAFCLVLQTWHLIQNWKWSNRIVKKCSLQCKSLTSVVVINPHVPVARADRKLYLAMDSVSAHIKIFGRRPFSLSTTTLHIMCISLTQHLLYVRCRRNTGFCPFSVASLLGCLATGDLKLLSVIWIRHSFAAAEFEKSAS